VLACEAAKDATHHREDKAAATADNDRQEDGKESSAGGGLVGPGQADALDHNAPDAGDESTANREDHEWISRPRAETDDAEGCLKGPSRATDEGQAEVQDGRADKEAKGD
jgi:hypothetical protein